MNILKYDLKLTLAPDPKDRTGQGQPPRRLSRCLPTEDGGAAIHVQ